MHLSESVDRRQLQAKFRGALLGGAGGDAIGAPFKRIGVSRAVLEQIAGESRQLRYTDDTI
jgi:hypothetical protein